MSETIPVKTTDLRSWVATAGKLFESGLVGTALDVLGLAPGGGLLKLFVQEGLPAIGKALGTITADEVTLEDVAAAVAQMRRVGKYDLAKDLEG